MPSSPRERVPGSLGIRILLVVVDVQNVIMADGSPDVDHRDGITEPVDLV